MPTEYLLCDKGLNKKFIRECLKRGIGGSAVIWNRLLLKLRKSGSLPRSTKRPPRISTAAMNRYEYAAEVAWRLIADEFGSGSRPVSLDDIFCCPDSAEYFDQIAEQYCPRNLTVTSIQYRRAALTIRKRTKKARRVAERQYSNWTPDAAVRLSLNDVGFEWNTTGAYLVLANEVPVFAGEARNLKEHLAEMFDNPSWQKLEANEVLLQETGGGFTSDCALKSVIVREQSPLLNSREWWPKQASKKLLAV